MILHETFWLGLEHYLTELKCYQWASLLSLKFTWCRDESLLNQGLALNDDLQRVLAKHESITSGSNIPSEKPKPESIQSLVDVDAPLVDTGDSKQSDNG